MYPQLLEDSVYVPKKVNKGKKKPISNKKGYITRDIGFELIFGFKDKLDIPMYKESDGLEERSIPKVNEVIFE